MAVFVRMCDTYLCRLCGEENRNGRSLFPTAENSQDLSELVNKYLPIKVENDQKLPTKICPGCNIQLEATKCFMDLIIEGQNKLRLLYKQKQDEFVRQEKQRLHLEEVLKTVNPSSSVDTYAIQRDATGEKYVIVQICSQGPLFPPGHELSLRAEGLDKPRRKRGRPPKSSQPPKEPEPVIEIPEEVVPEPQEEALEIDGKRKRRIKVPSRFSEVLQGKELDRAFKREGVIDEEFSDHEGADGRDGAKGEVIGRLESENGEDLGQPVLINRTSAKKYKSIGSQKKRRKFQCEICGREFLHHGRYTVHKKSHKVMYSCTQDSCTFTADTKPELEKHQESTGHVGSSAKENLDQIGVLELSNINVSETQPEDKQSNEGTENVDDGGKPIVRNDKSYLCPKCQKSFSCKQNYLVHLKAVHKGERPFSCDLCDQSFSYANSLRVHQLRHTKKPNAPSEADDSGGQKGEFRCLYCPRVFRHPSSLQYHRDSEHTNGRRFVCNKCDKPFKHRQLLQRHQLVHSDDRPHQCTQCEATFKTRANLLHHVRSVHSGQKNHWCTHCGKTFVHKTALRLHQRWHSGVRPYQCDICQKSFTQKGNLAEHRRIHTGEKPYKCDNCGKSFTTSSQYRLHCKRHLDERPHKCDYCSKSFLHKVTLRCHMRRHFDEKPYRCQLCTKAFPEAWALKKHERMHTGEKPYKCELCAKTFSDSSNLAKHRKTHRYRSTGQKPMVYFTYPKPESTVIHYINPQETLLTSVVNEETTEEIQDHTFQLQELVDQAGNPISFTNSEGEIIKVVTTGAEGDQDNLQGLLPDGTLIPLNLTTISDDKKSGSSLPELQEDKMVLSGQQLLDPGNIQFLDGDVEGRVSSNIQFVTEDNQNLCLMASYNIEDAINPEFLSLS